MNLVANTRSTLSDLADLIQKLTPGEFTSGCEELGNATIGQHSRHIIELFQCLTDQYASGTINYDLIVNCYIISNIAFIIRRSFG